ncbi:MAG: DUF192 domain-containing protein [Solirubrobacteraceae bacterium]
MHVLEATTYRERARGLARRDDLPADLALHIPHCRSVHTFCMRFALDLAWLDGAGQPVRVDGDVPPRRLRTCLGARSVLECRAGQAVVALAAQARRMAELAELRGVAPEPQVTVQASPRRG